MGWPMRGEGRKSPLKREPSLPITGKTLHRSFPFWEGEPIGEDGVELTMEEPSLASGRSPQY